MIHDGRVRGLPLVNHTATKSEITGLALTAADAGALAWATDTDEICVYDGAAWHCQELTDYLTETEHTAIGDASPHHTRYEDTEAVSAMGAKADSNPLNHDRYTDGEAETVADTQIATHASDADAHHAVFTPTDHTAIGDASPHHARYEDTEAVSAMGAKADSNPLNHDRYTDGEAETVADTQIAAHASDADAHHDLVTLSAAADAVLSLATQQVGLDTQAANTVFAGPATGADAAPTFRSLAFADIPSTSDGDSNPSTVLASDANGGLRIDRLGVGVAAIAASGTIALPDAAYIGNGAATARLEFDSSGGTDYAHFEDCYVGIRTDTPEEPLDVAGGVSIGTSSGCVLNLRRTSANYIWANDTGGYLVFGGDGSATSLANATFYTKTNDDVIFKGNVGIVATTPAYRLDIADGALGVSDLSGDPSAVTDYATFYGKDVGGTVEAFAQDEAGNAAQLTAHPTGDLPFTPEPWEHIASYSNAYLGIRRYFRIEKALRYLEQESGEQFIYDEQIPRRDWHLDQAAQGTRKPRPGWMRDFIANQT